MTKSTGLLSVLTVAILVAVLFAYWNVSRELAAVRATIDRQQTSISQVLSRVPSQPGVAVLQAEQNQGPTSLSLDGMQRDLSALSAQVNDQTMLVNRALGSILPYKLPDDVNAQIKDIEDQLSNESSWPKTAADVEQVRARLASVVEKLPPWAQEELLPHLVPIRWNIEALWQLLGASTADADELSGYATICESLLSNRPIGSSDSIAGRLETRRQETEESIAKAAEEDAIKTARAVRDAKRPHSVNDIAASARSLAAYSSPEAEQLTADLIRIVFQRSVQDAISDLRMDVEKYTKMGDGAVKEYAIGRTAAATMDLHLRLISSGVDNKDLYDKLRSLETALATMSSSTRAARQQKYQKWALDNIKQVPSYQKVLSAEIAKIPSALDRTNLASQARKSAEKRAQIAVREGMVAHLAPIDQAALDIAVGQWFSKVYLERFSHLDDEEEQTKLVEGFARTPKESLESLP